MKVAFVYSGGREGRGSDGPSDFFYGAREMQGFAGWDVECIDLDSSPADPLAGLIGKALGNYLPPRTSADWIARCRRVLPRLRAADMVVATATEISFGLAIWKALGFFKKPMVGILCGVVNYPIRSELRRKWVANLLGKFRPVLFADSELPEMVKRFRVKPEFLEVCWFGVDEKFWSLPDESTERDGVLAIGNDSRRDFETLVESARLCKNLRFTVITRRQKPSDLPNNVDWRRGDWKQEAFTDEELRSHYQKAACVVVPLEECIQPSGQSVAMQAMMCGAPVIHTNTTGWWGGDVVRDGKEIALVPPRSPELLATKIRSVWSRDSQTNARAALLNSRWTAGGFAERLTKVLEKTSYSDDLAK